MNIFDLYSGLLTSVIAHSSIWICSVHICVRKIATEFIFVKANAISSINLAGVKQLISYNSGSETSFSKLAAFIFIGVFIILVINLLINRRKQDSLISNLKEELKIAQDNIAKAKNKIIFQATTIKSLQRGGAELMQQNSISYSLFTEILQANLTTQSKLASDKKNEVILNVYLQNIVAIKKLEDNHYPLRIEYVSLEKIEAELKVSISPLEFNDRIQLEFTPNAIKSIKTDPYLLQLVLLNLLLNAFAHSEILEPVKIRIDNAAENQLKISVIDFGKGIPRKHQNSIFKKYFHLHNKSVYGMEPAGLGLYLCKLTLEKLEGKIVVDSKEGEGATFIVSLPIENKFA